MSRNQPQPTNKMNYQKILQNIYERLDDYRSEEFTECDLESLALALEAINEDLHDNSSDEEFSLVRDCEGKIGEAERFFEDISRQEQIDEELDQRRYESARQFN